MNSKSRKVQTYQRELKENTTEGVHHQVWGPLVSTEPARESNAWGGHRLPKHLKQILPTHITFHMNAILFIFVRAAHGNERVDSAGLT